MASEAACQLAMDLRVAAAHTNVLSASPRVEAGTRLDFTNGMTLQMYGGVGVTLFNQSKIGAKVQLSDAPGPIYFNRTSDIPQDRFKSTAGVDLKANDRVDERLEYQGEFATRFRSNAGSLKVSYKIYVCHPALSAISKRAVKSY